MFNLIILRGVSGCGKSETAKLLALGVPGSVICSADDYFMEDGVYKFIPTELPRAHFSCQMRVEYAMKISKPMIIVDNTNTLAEHMLPYEKLAQIYGYRIIHLVVENRHGNVSSKAPPHSCKRQNDQLSLNLKFM